MVTQLTITDDVGKITVAANDGSVSGQRITWYCYERPFGTGTTIYIQRNVDGVFEAEVRFLAEGQNPEIFFDPVTTQWVFTYTLNEKLYMILIDELDAPVTQGSQTGTLIDHLRLRAFSREDKRTVAETANTQDIYVAYGDADNSPVGVTDIAIAASNNVGNTFNIRWRASPSTSTSLNLNVAGFNVYLRRYSDGALVRVNDALIPFEGFDPKIYEYEVPALAGKYYVTQVSYRSSSTRSLVEGRIRYPTDETLSDGSTLPNIISSIAGQPRAGGGFTLPNDLTFTVVDVSPVVSIQNDDFKRISYGAGVESLPISQTFYEVIQLGSGSPESFINEPFTRNAFGAGLRLYISSSGQGIINVG